MPFRPLYCFAGTDAPTNWAGEPASVTVAENYTALENVQWTFGKHAFTFGGQVAWMLYNVINDTSGTSPITLTTAVTETSAINPSSNSATQVCGNLRHWPLLCQFPGRPNRQR